MVNMDEYTHFRYEHFVILQTEFNEKRFYADEKQFWWHLREAVLYAGKSVELCAGTCKFSIFWFTWHYHKEKKNTVKFIMGLDIICIDGIEYVSLLALGRTSQWKIASGKEMTFLLQC